MRSFVKDFSNSFFSKIAIIIFSFFKGVIIARYLGPEKNGVIASLMVYPIILMSLGSLGIRQTAAYFTGKKLFSEQEIQGATIQLWLLSSFFSIIICYILTTNFIKGEYSIYYILLVIAQIPFTLFNTFQSGIYLGKNKISKFNQISWLSAFVVLLFTILLVIVFKLSIMGALVALIIGPVLVFLQIIFVSKIRVFDFKFNKKVIVAFLSKGSIYALSFLLINLNYKIDIIILNQLVNDFQVGIYSKGVLLAEYLWQVPMVFSSIIFARSASSKDNHSFSNKVAALTRLSLCLVALMSVVIFLNSTFIVTKIFGLDYILSSDVLNILLPGVVLMTFFKVLYMDTAGKGKPIQGVYIMLPALIINLILNFLLIPKYSVNGAALASSISYGFAGIAILLFYNSENRVGLMNILVIKREDIHQVLSKLLNKK